MSESGRCFRETAGDDENGQGEEDNDEQREEE